MSTLLCMATVGLWVYSAFRADGFMRDDSWGLLAAAAKSGQVLVLMEEGGNSEVSTAPPVGTSSRYSRIPAAEFVGPLTLKAVGCDQIPFNFLGLGWGSKPSVGSRRASYVSVPLWLSTLLFGAAPAAWTYSRLRRRRLDQEGLCARCGYDLRATPERCPECGSEPRVREEQAR